MRNRSALGRTQISSYVREVNSDHRDAAATASTGDYAGILPSFVIIGAQKAASTTLHHQLASHPEIFLPSAEALVFEDPHYQGYGVSPLFELMSHASPGSIVGIKRSDYLSKPNCAERIKRHLPDAKLIAILRNPIERSISAYYHYMLEGHVPIRPLEPGLKAIMGQGYGSRWPRASEIIDSGFYYRHLTNYLRLFDGSQLFVVLQEDLLQDTSNVLRSLYSFVGVSTDIIVERPLESHRTGVYSLTRLRYRSMVRPLIGHNNDGRTRSFARRQLLPRALLGFDRRVLARTLPSQRPCPSAALHARLRAVYRDDVLALQDVLNRDLSSWLAVPAQLRRDGPSACGADQRSSLIGRVHW